MLHEDLTRRILGICFDILNELGSGFLESVYKKALLLALGQAGLSASAEVKLEVYEGTHGFDLPTDFERMRAAFAWLRGEDE